ncbi:MAG: radical SAM protein [Candidatus Aminicenantes bacterium]|jgi:hypothetical protein
MNKTPINRQQQRDSKNEKILLALLPFWTSLIPPLGISCLKSHLEPHGFHVTTLDATIERQFRDLYHNYLNLIRADVPENKRGNFYRIGHDVLRDHLLAHLNCQDKTGFVQLVEELIYKSFYWTMPRQKILKLIHIIDTFYPRLETYVLNWLEKEEPDVLGLSVFSDTLAASMFTFKITREKYPHIKTVMGGGVFADLLDIRSENFKRFLKKTEHYIDNIIVGEGELLLHKLLSGELDQSQRVFTAKDIDGEILDLDSAEIPDFSNLQLEYYPYLSFYTSRSCPFQCGFCSETLQWGKYRKKQPENVVRQITRLSQIHRRRVFLLGDSLLNPVINGLAREFIKSPQPVYWDGYLRVDKHTGDIQNTLLWRQGGFYRARLGLESGSQHVLNLMGKEVTVKQIKDGVFNLARAGIKTTTYWVIGYPGETEADFQMTLELVRELSPMIYEAECQPFYFFLSGQVNSNNPEWGKNKKIPLFPEREEMLLLQTWIMDCQPSREEIYERVSRFMTHCRSLGIPNPYTLQEIHSADKRWKKLHKNAVPSLIDFSDENPDYRENKKVSLLQVAKKRPVDDDPWL